MVLDSGQDQDLDQAAQASNKSHLVLGSLYVPGGLLDDAAARVQGFDSREPESPLAKKMLKQVPLFATTNSSHRQLLYLYRPPERTVAFQHAHFATRTG